MAGESERLGGDPGSLLFLLCQRSINRFSRRLNHVKVFFFEYGLFIFERMLWSVLQPCEGTEKVVCVCMFVRAYMCSCMYVSLRVHTWLRVRMCVCVCVSAHVCVCLCICEWSILVLQPNKDAFSQRWRSYLVRPSESAASGSKLGLDGSSSQTQHRISRRRV